MNENNRILQNISFFVIFVLCASLLFTGPLVASASAPEYIEFFDFDRYSTYSTNDEYIYANVSLPTDWFYAGYRSGDFSEVVNSTTVTINNDNFGGGEFNLSFNNTFDYLEVPVVGNRLSSGRFFDLKYFPDGSFITFSYTLSGSSSLVHDFSDHVLYIVYVDRQGEILSSVPMGISVNSSVDNLQRPTVDYTAILTLTSNNVPNDAYGFYFFFDVQGETWPIPNVFVNVTFNAFNVGFRYTELDYNLNNEKIVRDTLSNIEDALNGTPQQNQQAQSAIGGLNNSTNALDDLGDSLASVDKPSIDSNQISADSLVPDTSLVVLSSPFQALWENNQLLAMLTIVVTLVLVSWVFFGKKA